MSTHPVICTLANINALTDLKVFFFTLELHNTLVGLPKIYLLCDSAVINELSKNPLYKGQLECRADLDKYKNHTRQQMESMPGTQYKTLWEDFMMEKASVLEWAFSNPDNSSAYFFDSDICFMSQLPEIPAEAKIAVSQHMIKKRDEDKYGTYNAGYLWTSSKTLPDEWRNAAKTSRYYDQAALETIVANYPEELVYKFPVQHNFGWWRLFQGVESPDTILSRWTFFRNDPKSSVGIRVEGKALGSIHTHWGEVNDRATLLFNRTIYRMISKIAKHDQATLFLNFLRRTFPNIGKENL